MRAFHFTAARYALENIRNQRLKVARIMDLNDPFEFLCGDLRDAKARQAFRRFKEFEANRSGVLCFSKGWRNPLMWSHYADRHKGVVLEFELHDDLPETIVYESQRFAFDVPWILASGGFTEEHARRIYSTKAAHWQYERELRVAVRLSACSVEKDLYFEPFSKDMRLVGVILGPFCELDAEEIRNAVPSGLQIRLRRARLAFRTFNVVRDKSFREEVIRGNG